MRHASVWACGPGVQHPVHLGSAGVDVVRGRLRGPVGTRVLPPALLLLQGLLGSPAVLGGRGFGPWLLLSRGEEGVEDDAGEVDEAGDEEHGLPLACRLVGR